MYCLFGKLYNNTYVPASKCVCLQVISASVCVCAVLVLASMTECRAPNGSVGAIGEALRARQKQLFGAKCGSPTIEGP